MFFPSKESLFKRKLAPDPLCPVCHRFPETLEHLFLFCEWVKEIKKQSPTPALLANILWRLWKERNRVAFHGIQPRSVTVVDGAESDRAIFDKSMHSHQGERGRKEISPQTWISPGPNEWSFNVDGSWKEGENSGSVAGICRDSSGAIVFGFAEEETARSALELETLGILRALREVQAEKVKLEALISGGTVDSVRKVQRMDILTDSIYIPIFLEKPEESPWAFRSLFLDCNAIISRIGKDKIRVVHVLREANGVADWIAEKFASL